MKSKLFHAVVLVGISWGGAGTGCFAESRRREEAPEPKGTAGSSGSGSTAAGAGHGGTAGSRGDESGGTAGRVIAAGGESGAPEPAMGGTGGIQTGGAAGTGGIDTGGAPGTGGIADAGTDAPADAFCDETWPTTKGNPAPPPTCEDQAACGGPPADATFPQWLQCRPRLGELHCDYLHVTSVCEDGAWVCPAGSIRDEDCRCLGPVRPGMRCTEDGFVPVDAGSGDAGAAGAPG